MCGGQRKARWHMGSNSLCQFWGRDTDSLSLWDHLTHGGTRLVLRRTCWCKWGHQWGGVKRTNCALTVPDGVYQLKRTYSHLSHVKGMASSLIAENLIKTTTEISFILSNVRLKGPFFPRDPIKSSSIFLKEHNVNEHHVLCAKGGQTLSARNCKIKTFSGTRCAFSSAALSLWWVKV